MPIRGYLCPRRGAYATGRPILGRSGIAVDGPVLDGRMDLDAALLLDRIRALRDASDRLSDEVCGGTGADSGGLDGVKRQQ